MQKFITNNKTERSPNNKSQTKYLPKHCSLKIHVRSADVKMNASS